MKKQLLFIYLILITTNLFSQNEKPQIGFLLSLKDVELLKDCDILEFQIKIKKDTSFDLLNEFSFELINQNDIYAKGTFIVKLQD